MKHSIAAIDPSTGARLTVEVEAESIDVAAERVRGSGLVLASDVRRAHVEPHEETRLSFCITCAGARVYFPPYWLAGVLVAIAISVASVGPDALFRGRISGLLGMLAGSVIAGTVIGAVLVLPVVAWKAWRRRNRRA